MKKHLNLWFLLNIIGLIGLPIVYGLYLNNEIQYQYETGLRTSTDGDSISIPVFGVAVINTILLGVVNAIILIVSYVKRQNA